MESLSALEEKEYDGRNFPAIINKLLTNDGVIFGGSSLIHDVYFLEEDWGERDYDLWCLNSQYFKIQNHLRKETCKKTKEERYENRYGRLRINGICEYIYKIDDTTNIKIQLINVGNDFSLMVKNLDFTFVSVIYDGKKIKFFNTIEKEIMEKKGNIIIYRNNGCTCDRCKRTSEISEKTAKRIEKYQKRGFTFFNLCQFCSNKVQSFKHFIKCRNLLEDDKLKEDGSDDILELGLPSDNPEIIYCCLYYFSKIYDSESFMDLFNCKKHLLLNHHTNYYELINNFVRNGKYTYFRCFFENTNYSFEDKDIQKFFEVSCERNYINISRYLSNKFPRMVVDIFEDKIIRYKILSIFEYYLETNDPEIITKEYPQIQFFEKDEEIICPICKCYPSNIELKCEHTFCDKCLMSYFALCENKGKKLRCGICRTII